MVHDRYIIIPVKNLCVVIMRSEGSEGGNVHCQPPHLNLFFFDIVNLHDPIILFMILYVQKLLYVWFFFGHKG
jgi:hypothetical protein